MVTCPTLSQLALAAATEHNFVASTESLDGFSPGGDDPAALPGIDLDAGFSVRPANGGLLLHLSPPRQMEKVSVGI